jgi:hypothetical protein
MPRMHCAWPNTNTPWHTIIHMQSPVLAHAEYLPTAAQHCDQHCQHMHLATRTHATSRGKKHCVRHAPHHYIEPLIRKLHAHTLVRAPQNQGGRDLFWHMAGNHATRTCLLPNPLLHTSSCSSRAYLTKPKQPGPGANIQIEKYEQGNACRPCNCF